MPFKLSSRQTHLRPRLGNLWQTSNALTKYSAARCICVKLQIDCKFPCPRAYFVNYNINKMKRNSGMRFAETKKFDQRETFLEIRGAVFFFSLNARLTLLPLWAKTGIWCSSLFRCLWNHMSGASCESFRKQGTVDRLVLATLFIAQPSAGDILHVFSSLH